MYVAIGKCIQCDAFKNLLDGKGIQKNYLDMTEMPNKTMSYLRMYYNKKIYLTTSSLIPLEILLLIYDRVPLLEQLKP